MPETKHNTITPMHHGEGEFTNTAPKPKGQAGSTFKMLWEFLNKPAHTVPQQPIPVVTLNKADLLAAPDLSVFRLGHSTVLLKLHQKFWLTDPVFSKRASPFRWMGPSRFHAPPISIAELPEIEGVILSHNHYDHLDKSAVLALADKTNYFLAPLGVGAQLIKWGISANKVHEHDWWEETTIDGIRLIATPAQHFSGRGLTDSNQTLWCSWAIVAPTFRLFFSGDTGYFEGFKEIGERLGPFDLTLIETGAYDQRWAFVHMQPEQTLQAHLDLQGQVLMPIHNGTFDLAFHAWQEPFERITALAQQHRVRLSTPRMGEAIDLLLPRMGSKWWQQDSSRMVDTFSRTKRTCQFRWCHTNHRA